MTFPFPFVNAGPGRITYDLVGEEASPTISGNTATFSMIMPTGLLVFLVSPNSGGERILSTVTVEESSGDVVIAQGNNSVGIGSFVNSAAGAKEVVFAFSGGNINACYVRVYALKNFKSPIAHATDSAGGPGTSRSVTISVPEKGLAFILLSKGTGNFNPITWVGANVLFENYTTNDFGAVIEADAAVTNRTVTASWTGSTGTAMVAASWS